MSQTNTSPLEVINPLYDLYWAAVGATFPLVDAVPDAGTWTKIGTGGFLNYDEEGVSVEIGQELTPWRSLGDAGIRKIFRKSEDAKFGILLVDMTLEQVRHAVNYNAVTTVAPGVGTAGYKKLGGSRGLSVNTVALLLRASISPYMESGNHQYQVWVAAQSGQPKPVAVKDKPVGYALEWTALVDPSQAEAERQYVIVAQTDAAGT